MRVRHIRGGEKYRIAGGRMSYSEEQSGLHALSVSVQRVKHGSKNVKSRKKKRETAHVQTDTQRN